MTSNRTAVERLLRDWKGEDHVGGKTPQQLAADIDQEYEKYLASLPQQTAAVKAGQTANERRVA